MNLRSLLQIPDPDTPVTHWHISPRLDVGAYALSWIWVLLPLLFFGPDRKVDYLYLYMFAVVIIDIHRHYGLPYVYLDRQVTARFPLRFWIFPAVMFAAFCASPFLRDSGIRMSFLAICAFVAGALLFFQILRQDRGGEPIPWRSLLLALVPAGVGATLFTMASGGQTMLPAPALVWLLAALVASFLIDWGQLLARAQRSDSGERTWFFTPILILALVIVALVFGEQVQSGMRRGGVRVREVLNGVAVAAVIWNIWHVYMQKYGIMRMYNAKNGQRTKVPGWVDRLLVFAWLPLYFAWLGPRYKHLVAENFKKGQKTLMPFLEAVETIEWILLPVGIALVIFAIGIFVYWEHKVNGLKNKPRLWMAVGTTLLSSMFLLVDPIKAYLAYAFSHAVEYMVFVWAFQRRRYREELVHKPLLGRVLRHPVMAYVGFALVLAVAFTYLKYYGKYIFVEEDRPQFLDYNITTWFFYWTVFQSLVHFYFDGFLWKMRLPATRANL